MAIYDQIANQPLNFQPAQSFAAGQKNRLAMQHGEQDLEAKKMAAHKQVVGEIAQFAQWADTPEKWDQGVEHLRQMGMPMADQLKGRFDMRDSALAFVQKQAPKYTFKEVGAGGDARQLSAINEADPTQVIPVGKPFNKPSAQGGKLDEFYAKEGYKDVRKMNEDSVQAQSGINDIDRFLSLNESNATGPAMAIPGVTGIRSAFDADVAEMKSISDKLTPQMRQGMPGAASDRDVAMFRGATISIDKPYEANKNIGLGLKAANQNKVDRKDFMNAYYQSNQSLVGAEQKWQEYLNANPIFDPKAKKGSYDLNPSRKSWQEHFGVQQVQQPAQPPQDGGIKFLGFD